MYPVTDTFLQTIRAGGYTRYTSADLYFRGEFVTTLPIADGTVEVDRTAATRRSCTLTVADESFVPNFVNSPIAPYGAEIVLNSGVLYDNGQTELTQLGVFRIQEVSWQEAAGSLPKITGYDRSMVLQDAKTLFPLDLSGDAAFGFFRQFCQVVLDVPVNIDISNLQDRLLPGGSVLDSDRWAMFTDVAAAMGAEVFFDVHGNMVVQPIPGLDQSNLSSYIPVWEVDVGENGVLVDATRGVSRTGVYNAVGITGTASDNSTAPMGWAADTDPRSPTYWGPAESLPYGQFVISTFGEVVLRESNSLCTNALECRIAAEGRLKDVKGLARSLDFTSVWNPALQEGDIVRLTYLDGTTELHIIDKLHIPVGNNNDAQTASTRTLTYQLSANT